MDKKIKALLFDLDGVIVDAKEIHYNSLNNALPKEYRISWKDHLSIYDGLKTNQKLELLTEHKGLPIEAYSNIWAKKQDLTFSELNKLQPEQSLLDLFIFLKNKGLKIGVCSNSIRKTIVKALSRLQIIELVDFFISNEDVASSKPHPEMYWKAMIHFKVIPEEVIIVEDSPYGLLAASRTGATTFRVKSPKELTINNFDKLLTENTSKMIKVPKWSDKKLNVVIPMAGAGSRFANAGFTFPKPLIEVNGRPMIQVVIENLNIDANFIFIVRAEHRQEYKLDTMLNLIAPNCSIIEVSDITEGAACTVLLAEKFIDNENPVFFANSDQYVEWNSNDFFYKMNETGCDGGIPVFESTHPKWSFARTDDNGLVIEVKEKEPISNKATVGFYYFKHGKEFVKNAKEMIKENDRVNGEFYLCPVYNYLIKKGGSVRTFEVSEMWGLGTPEDLNTFLTIKS